MKLLTKTVMALSGVAAIGTAVVMYARKHNNTKCIEQERTIETLDKPDRIGTNFNDGDTIIHMNQSDEHSQNHSF